MALWGATGGEACGWAPTIAPAPSTTPSNVPVMERRSMTMLSPPPTIYALLDCRLIFQKSIHIIADASGS
jgi:hypothetical protein